MVGAPGEERLMHGIFVVTADYSKSVAEYKASV